VKTSSGTSLLIKFTSDGSGPRAGFTGTWTAFFCAAGTYASSAQCVE
jgi:hypothetical protein